MVVEHNQHKWQYYQSERAPIYASMLYFVCECGAIKEVIPYRERSPEIYQLPMEENK